MSNGKLLRQLNCSGSEVYLEAFRRVTKRVRAEERQKQHHLLTKDLEEILHRLSSNPSSSALRNPTATIPVERGRRVPLPSVREVVRGLEDVVVSQENMFAIEGIVWEHNGETFLRVHGVHSCDRVLFFGPHGCGRAPTVGGDLSRR